VPRVIAALSDTHTHTHSLGGTPLDKGSARCRDLYLTTQHKRDNISVLWAGFEPAIPVSLRLSSHWNRRPEILQAVFMETMQIQKERSRVTYLETGSQNTNTESRLQSCDMNHDYGHSMFTIKLRSVGTALAVLLACELRISAISCVKT
jgi:hypothetical protein